VACGCDPERSCCSCHHDAPLPPTWSAHTLLIIPSIQKCVNKYNHELQLCSNFVLLIRVCISLLFFSVSLVLIVQFQFLFYDLCVSTKHETWEKKQVGSLNQPSKRLGLAFHCDFLFFFFHLILLGGNYQDYCINWMFFHFVVKGILVFRSIQILCGWSHSALPY
jgi:hypothetical protein